MSGAKRRASVKLATVTLPSSRAAAAVYWKLNLPASPVAGAGRSTYGIGGATMVTRAMRLPAGMLARAASAAVMTKCVPYWLG